MMKVQKTIQFSKKWQRMIAAMLVFVLAATFMAACGNTQSEVDTSPSPAPTAAPNDTDANSGDPYALGVPLLWRATSPAGQSIYLFGSIHVGNAELYPLPDFIMDAFHRSDYLAVEFNLNEMDEDLMMAIGLMQFYLDGRTIVDDIGE